ncbi:hypothetical protein PACTADRAFT_51115 [Pachysolen tannophilus NRRL Y-2460]|uniref:BRCT domain-containing protein n=1 Tax=Pachysolen tannophilus NRRL Y-2460 TaxID=669874 RepID=A0A1E4TR65_PACTA|nr:hypothetical protein PACTADRAFT_51115 [Pachysolen tannophilus NRRL Y-2460]
MAGETRNGCLGDVKRANGSDRLFENFKVLIVESLKLPRIEIDILQKMLNENGCQETVINGGLIDELVGSLEFTHVVSNSVDFPGYGFADKNMIPVVTSNWIESSVQEKRLLPLRPYSPDDKYFLKDVFITVVGLPAGDVEAIHGGVRAFGGQFHDQLTNFTTHIITTNMDNSFCEVALACNKSGDSNIKIVVPHWIEDCFKAGVKLLDDPYVLPDPKILQKNHNKFGKKTWSLFQKKTVFISSDLELTETIRDCISEIINSADGKVVDDVESANCYIGKYREGKDFLKASNKPDVIVGNLNWLYWMLAHNEWSLPTANLLHYPYVKDGLPQFNKFFISTTNYTGDSRFYLSTLIESMGGNFTKTLKPTNTHLICARPVGKKYEAAKKWGKENNIHIVNHLWLEDTYTNWKIQDETASRYATSFPKVQALGQMPLDVQILKQFYKKEVNTPLKKDKLPTKTTKTTTSTITKELQSKPSSSPKSTTPIIEERGNPVHTTSASTSPPSTSASTSRSAKLKASAKLHSDMEDLNEFQKANKNSHHDKSPKLPSEMEELKNLKKINKQNVKKRNSPDLSQDNNEMGNEENHKRQKQKTTETKKKPYNIVALATGCENDIEFSSWNLKLLSKFGIKIIEEVSDLNQTLKRDQLLTIIAPKILRTEKFLTGLSYKLENLLTPDFLNDVIDLYKEGEEQDQQLLDVPSPQKYNLCKFIDYKDVKLKDIWQEPSESKILDLISKSQENSQIFKNKQIFILGTNHDKSKNAAYARILSAHGSVPPMISSKPTDIIEAIQENNESYLLCNDKKLITAFNKALKSKKKLKIKIKDWDWFVKRIFREVEVE